jgi:hypothetical protein
VHAKSRSVIPALASVHETDKYQTPQASWNSFEMRASRNQDEAPPWRGGLVDGPEGLNEEGQGAVEGHYLDDTLSDPRGELGGKSDLGRLVAPASVIRPARRAQGEVRLGHMKAALDNGGCSRVEGAEAPMPGGGSL